MISFIIPVYRSAENLPALCYSISNVFPCDFEIIFVEDCGGDNSWDVIKKLAHEFTFVRGFRMSRNFGQHNAILCGIRNANGEIIVTLDDDFQHPPEEIPKLLSRLNEGYDVVYGTPEKQQHGIFRNMASKITKLSLERVIGKENARHVSALRAFRTRLRDSFFHFNSPTVNIDVLLTWGSSNFSSVYVRNDERRIGESGYSIGKLMRHALNMITGFSTLPLQFASIMGIVLFIFGLIILVYVVANWLLRGSVVPGFAFLALIVSIFSGAQLLALGIIGEYLARVHVRIMERPPFVISDVAGKNSLCN